MNKTKDDVIAQLKNNTCEVTFTKKGTDIQRTLVCTLKQELIPQPTATKSEKNKAEPSTDAIRVYEVELQSWRSFNLSNLIAIHNKE